MEGELKIFVFDVNAKGDTSSFGENASVNSSCEHEVFKQEIEGAMHRILFMILFTLNSHKFQAALDK